MPVPTVPPADPAGEETGPCALESIRVDTRRIADPAVKEAIEAIEEKLNAITACTFNVRTVDTLAMVDAPALEVISEATCSYRWPCDFAVTTRYLTHGTPGMVGTINELRTNGTDLWDATLGTEESRAALQALRLSDRARGALLARQANPYVKVSTLSQLLAVSDPGLALTDMLHWLRAPFAHCDVPTLRLEAVDENGWIFNARPVASLQREFDRVRVWVDAATGVAVETTLFRPADGGRRVKTLSNVNVQPALTDADFVYAIPEGAVLAGDS
jgi:hypothetical protein